MNGDRSKSTADEKSTKPDIRSLQNPLDFIAEVHMREREVCALIDRIAASPRPRKEDCGEVLSFLKHHLLQHLEDEEADLFPMMLERCTPEEEIQRVIDRLKRDHRYARPDTISLIGILENYAQGRGRKSDEDQAQMTKFATRARRHLILENAIILAIARLRLIDKDLEIMKRHMLERRGLDASEEGSDAK